MKEILIFHQLNLLIKLKRIENIRHHIAENQWKHGNTDYTTQDNTAHAIHLVPDFWTHALIKHLERIH